MPSYLGNKVSFLGIIGNPKSAVKQIQVLMKETLSTIGNLMLTVQIEIPVLSGMPPIPNG